MPFPAIAVPLSELADVVMEEGDGDLAALAAQFGSMSPAKARQSSEESDSSELDDWEWLR